MYGRYGGGDCGCCGGVCGAGAGGGGYFLFYTDFSKRNKLINWIKKEGLIYTNFKFEDVGLKSWIERNN